MTLIDQLILRLERQLAKNLRRERMYDEAYTIAITGGRATDAMRYAELSSRAVERMTAIADELREAEALKQFAHELYEAIR